MSQPALSGRRVLVVGASAGIGRAVAIHAVRLGASVVMTARREDRLAGAIAEAGGGTAVAGDIAQPDDCRRIAEEAGARLGEVDLVVFAAGSAPLGPVEDATAAEWQATMAVNVVGINLVTAALLPALAPGAIVAALSSEAVAHARYGLAAYCASKAALEMSLRSWRLEHPEIRFTCVAVGATAPTEFGSAFDLDMLDTALRAWALQGLAQKEYMAPEDIAVVLLGLLATALSIPGVGVEHVVLRSPSGALA